MKSWHAPSFINILSRCKRSFGTVIKRSQAICLRCSLWAKGQSQKIYELPFPNSTYADLSPPPLKQVQLSTGNAIHTFSQLKQIHTRREGLGSKQQNYRFEMKRIFHRYFSLQGINLSGYNTGCTVRESFFDCGKYLLRSPVEYLLEFQGKAL